MPLLDRTAAPPVAGHTHPAHPDGVVANLGPNWFAAVMGTGIVALAAVTLPVTVPGLHTAATVVWALAALLLAALTVGAARQWHCHRAIARGHAADPLMAPFWGAVAMAVMTVGAGSTQLGAPVLGATTALAVGGVLWAVGTALGLTTAVAIPYLMVTEHRIGVDGAVPAWLMPVVPPMVSAANGALLVPHVPAGSARATMLLACYAMVGASLVATLVLLPAIWHTLAVHGLGPVATVPTLWIVLGPLGQSVTATNLLANAAPGVLPEPYATGAQVLGLLYGVPTWGFAMLWFALAAAVTLRTVRRGLPFAPTWWSFTFPLGTCVTGTGALAARTHLPAFVGVATGLYTVLVLAWVVVAVRSGRRVVVHGAM